MFAVTRRGAVLALLGVSGIVVAAPTLRAQGCEPIRFTTPVNLGGEGEAYQPGREWRLTLAYRRLHSNEWYSGTERADASAPGGVAPDFKINTLIADVAYAFNDRFRARVSVPLSSGRFYRRWADGQFHEQTASGIGDVSVQGEAWLFQPKTHESGNISLGLGVKAPTGSHTKPSKFYLGTGAVDFPADQTIQPGDGGWAILTQAQGFRKLTERFSLYGVGSYMLSLRDHTDIAGAPAPAPNSGLYWSVPDVYSARAGGVVDVLPDHGISLSLGARLDGIPVHDLIGGGDEGTIKRTSRIVFADPGLSYSHGKDNVTLSVPYRVYLNRTKSLTEQLPGASPTANSGGFARYLIFVSYSRRI